MEKRIAVSLTKWCMLYKKQSPECELAIQYGLELILNNLLKAILILTVSAFWGKFWEAVIVLISFASLRYFAGGRHMKTSFGCFIVMCCISFVSIILADYFIWWTSLSLVILFILGICGLAYFAPLQSKANPVIDENIIRNKRRGSILIFILLSSVVILLPLDMKGLIVFPTLIEIISITPLFERRDRFEKDSNI